MKNAKTLSKSLHAVGMVAIIFGLSFMMINVADAATTIEINAEPENEVYPGGTITYTIKATNNVCPQSDITIVNDFSRVMANASLLSLDIDNYEDKGSIIQWTDTINCGEPKIYEMKVIVDSDASISATLKNSVRIFYTGNDQAEPGDSVTTTIVASPLSVIKTVDKTLANPSDTLSYTVTVSNSGNTPATYVELVDTLPAGFTFADTSSDDTTIYTWKIEKLDVNDTADFKYDVHIDSLAGVGTYTNTAIATSYDTDNEKTRVAIATSEPATASTEVKIPVVLGETSPSLTITKTVDKDYTNPGGTATYTVIVSNDGDAPALNAVLDDVLPIGFVFVDTGNTTATWNLNDIVPTESVTTTYDVKIDASILAGKYINTATVSADDVDGVSAKADLEVKEVLVLGAEEEVILPTTGGGLAVITLSGLMLIGSGIFIRRKIK